MWPFGKRRHSAPAASIKKSVRDKVLGKLTRKQPTPDHGWFDCATRYNGNSVEVHLNYGADETFGDFVTRARAFIATFRERADAAAECIQNTLREHTGPLFAGDSPTDEDVANLGERLDEMEEFLGAVSSLDQMVLGSAAMYGGPHLERRAVFFFYVEQHRIDVVKDGDEYWLQSFPGLELPER